MAGDTVRVDVVSYPSGALLGSTTFSGTTYTLKTVAFSTSGSVAAVQIGIYKTVGTGDAYADDFTLTDISTSSNRFFYPAAFTYGPDNSGNPGLTSIITVAATDNRDILAPFSNYGPNAVQVAAPGVNIYTTLLGGSIGYVDGTSFAAPLVAGIIALEASINPYLSAVSPLARAVAYKAALVNGVDVISSLGGKVSSGGRVNATKALAEAALIADPDFEYSSLTTSHNGTASWTITGTAALVASPVHTPGGKAVKLGGSGTTGTSDVHQSFSGLMTSTGYVASGWVRVDAGQTATFSMTPAGGGSSGTAISTSSSYEHVFVTFTTGTTGSAVLTLSCPNTNSSGLGAYFDDLTIEPDLNSGSAGITKSGADTLIVSNASGSFTNSGPITILGGTLQFDSASGTFGASYVVNNGTLAFNSPNSLSVSAIISGSGSVAQIGSGTTTLSGTNSYSGGTTIKAGKLAISSDANLGITGSSTGVSYQLLGYGYGYTSVPTVTVSGAGSGATFTPSMGVGSLNMSNAGAGYTVSPTITFGAPPSGGRTASGFTVRYASGQIAYIALTDRGAGYTSAPSVSVTGGGATTQAVITVNNLLLTDYSASSGSGYAGLPLPNISISGGGGSGANVRAYLAGLLTIDGGTLLTTASLSCSRNVLLSGASSTIEAAAGTSTSFTGKIFGAGKLVKEGAGSLTLAQSNTYTGGTVLNNGTLAVGGLGALGTSGAITFGGGSLQFTSANTSDYSGRFATSASQPIKIDTNGQIVTFASNLAGVGTSLTKSGAGALALSGSNAYSGGTNLNGGVLSLRSAGALGTTGTISFGGGTLQYGALNTTDYSSRFSTAAGQSIAIDTNGQSVTFGTALTSFGGSLTKVGIGSLGLTGTNTYTGGTVVSNGTLVFATPLTTSTSLSVADGAVAQLAAGGGKTLKFGTLNLNLSGKLDLTDGNLIVTGSTSSPLNSYLQRGYANGAWTGSGLSSTSAANDPSHTMAISWAAASDLGVTSWGGVTGLSGTALLTKYASFGDANLSGAITADDYALADAGRAGGSHTGTWVGGDFNYNGTSGDPGDYLLLDTSYGHQTGALAAGYLSMYDVSAADFAIAAPDVYAYQDIGSPACGGSTTGITPGADYDLTAGGTGFWGTADQFHFAWQQLAGDFDIRVWLGIDGAAAAGAMAGLMARLSLAANSPFDFVGQIAGGSNDATLQVLSRSTAGAAASGWNSTEVPNYSAFPWLRMRRIGNTVYGYASTNGVQWLNWTSLTLPAGTGAIYVGMAATASASTGTVTAHFRNLSATPAQSAVTIQGTDADDAIYLRLDASKTNLQVWHHLPINPDDPVDPPDQSFAYDAIDSLHINGYGGDDTVYLDFGNGTFYFNQNVYVDGGAGDDRLVVLGTTGGGDAFGRYAGYDYFCSGINFYTNAHVSYAGLEHHQFDGRGGWDSYEFGSGTWVADVDLGAGNPNLNVSLASGAHVTFAADQDLFLAWFNGGDFTTVGNGTTATHVTIHTSGVLGSGLSVNFGDGGSLIDDYSGSSPAATFLALLAAGYNGGSWDGSGMYSLAAAFSNGVYGIGWAEASSLLGLSGSQTATWEGHTVDATTLIFKYTLVGDMNLDGALDASDFSLWDVAVAANSPASWITGDFNYDGVRDSADQAMMAWAYAHQGDVSQAHLVADVNAGSTGSYPSNLLVIGGVLYFTADDGVHGTELWKTDGTAAGTVMVKDIVAGAGGSYPYDLTNIGGTLYFTADDGNGLELWKSDGTATGTVMVKDLAGAGSGWADTLTDAGDGTLFFWGYADDGGYVLWHSDGTAAGTTAVQEFYASPDDQEEGNTPNLALTAVGGTAYFAAYDEDHGYELWRSDGTAAGTYLLKDIDAGTDPSYPSGMVNVGGTLFFSAYDPEHGYELWKTNGTASGTVMVKDIVAGTDGSSAMPMVGVGGVLYFQVWDPISGGQLWRSDGTAAGTYVLQGVQVGSFATVGTTLYFSAYTPSAGWELWTSDGTAAGTVMVKDIAAGTASSYPSSLTAVGDQVYFVTYGAHGSVIYVSDGTPAGTRPVALGYGGLVDLGGIVCFVANDGLHGTELWSL